MQDIFYSFQDPVGWIVVLAAATQAVAQLFRRQVALRTLLLTGNLLYITYYALVADEPLWPAILSTAMIVAGGVIGLARLFLQTRR